jgi:hypothetical protein
MGEVEPGGELTKHYDRKIPDKNPRRKQASAEKKAD